MSALTHKADIDGPLSHVRFVPKVAPQKRPPIEMEPGPTQSGCQLPLTDDVHDLERHHYLAGLIDCLDERGDCAAIGLGFRGYGFKHGHAYGQRVSRTHWLEPAQL